MDKPKLYEKQTTKGDLINAIITGEPRNGVTSRIVATFGKRDGAGRPTGSTRRKPKRETVKQVRWTEAEWANVEQMAGATGMTPSEFIRRATLTVC